MKVYIRAFARISRLDPEPDIREFLTPMEARRLSRMSRRAIWTCRTVLREAGLERPDAIITGTGLGCIENTESFLMSLTGVSDAPLRPTAFMQSTHNTVSSLLAIHTKCHGYNATYSHLGISFESALRDAMIRLETGSARNVLVSAFEELTPTMARMLEKYGYAHQIDQDGKVSETAVSMLLTTDPADALCVLEDVRLFRRKEDWETAVSQAGPADIVTREDCAARYGGNLSVTALGVCDAAEGGRDALIVNDFYGKNFSLVKLSALCGN